MYTCTLVSLLQVSKEATVIHRDDLIMCMTVIFKAGHKLHFAPVYYSCVLLKFIDLEKL